MIVEHLNRFAAHVYNNAVEHGWHNDIKDRDGFLSDALNNIVGEVSELWEARRRGELFKPCDKAEEMKKNNLPPLTCIEEEFADIIIRVLDDCVRLGVDIGRAVEIKHEFNKTRPYRHGGKLV